MKLYYSKGACSIVIRTAINEMGLDCSYESVDLRTKKTETGADYLSINPKGAVPALETSHGLLTENAVILQYLADSNHATQLLPPVSDFKRYRVLEWLNYVATELHKGFSPLFNPEIPQDVKEKVFIPTLQKKYAFIDKHLAKNKFLCGDHFALPDCYILVTLLWSGPMKVNISDLPNLTRYFDDLKNRKSVQKSLADEGLIK